jgi:hypothetical protein
LKNPQILKRQNPARNLINSRRRKQAYLIGVMLFSFFFVFWVTPQVIYGAEKRVKLRVEVEGMPIKPSNVLVRFISENGTSFIAKLRKNSFIVPKEILKENTFDVQIKWDKYSVLFSSITQTDLHAIWTVGADKTPLRDSSLIITKNRVKDLVGVYYLKIDPNDLIKVQVVEIFR